MCEWRHGWEPGIYSLSGVATLPSLKKDKMIKNVNGDFKVEDVKARGMNVVARS